MIKRLPLLLALAGVCLRGRGEVLPPERLLPQDTALVVAAPDWPKAWSVLGKSSYGRMWADPALRPFKDKFLEKVTTDALEPLEQALNIKFSDYKDMAQGEAFFALVPTGQKEGPGRGFSQILVIDTGSHAPQMKTNLASITRKWTDAGKPIKNERIREVEFTTLIVSPGELSWNKIFPQLKPPAENEGGAKVAAKNTEITFGLVDSLLVVSDTPAVMEKLLTLQQGGLLAPLAEEPSFQADFGARLRGAPYYVWANVKEMAETFTKAPPTDDEDAAASAAKLNSVFSAIGIDGVTSACLSCQDSPEGILTQFFIGSPEGKRAGLLKVVAPEIKDANPPPFVPADAAKYWRWRINIPEGWTKLEAMLNDWNPQASKVMDFIFQNAGKDKDEHYDLKAELLANLGDDVINYQKTPSGNTFADLKSPVSLYLIGSPNPDKLSSALTVALGMLSQGNGVKDRDFLGRKIHTVTLGNPENPAAPSVSFAASGGYVALAANAGVLEEYLRSSDTKAKALADTEGLGDVAQDVGGFSTGWFGFENQKLEMRPMFELLHKQHPTVTDILGTPAIAGNMNLGEQIVSKLIEWSDFSLLPPYDAVSKYFYYSVYAGRFSPDGFTMKVFAPTPPALR